MQKMRTAELTITAMITKCIVLVAIHNEGLFPPIQASKSLPAFEPIPASELITASKSIPASKKIPVETLSVTNEMESAPS
jgi:hypothetical protein